MAEATPQEHVTLIRPPRGWLHIDFAELWKYRELLYFFCWRDLKVRYKQTLLGFAWAILGPVLQTVVFTLIFGKLAELPTDGLPQPVFYMAGLVIWKYFSQSLTMTSNCLVGGAHLLTKIYFPRVLLPISTVLTGLVDFVIAFGAFMILVAYFNVLPAPTAIVLPLFVLITVMTALGVGLFFAALNVKYRDVRTLVPFIVQFWMYASVIFPFSRFAEWMEFHGWGAWKYLFGLNPIAGVVEGFRWCLFSHLEGVTVQPPWPLLAWGAPVAVILLLAGLAYFRRVEGQFADIV